MGGHLLYNSGHRVETASITTTMSPPSAPNTLPRYSTSSDTAIEVDLDVTPVIPQISLEKGKYRPGNSPPRTPPRRTPAANLQVASQTPYSKNSGAKIESQSLAVDFRSTACEIDKAMAEDIKATYRVEYEKFAKDYFGKDHLPCDEWVESVHEDEGISNLFDEYKKSFGPGKREEDMYDPLAELCNGILSKVATNSRTRFRLERNDKRHIKGCYNSDGAPDFVALQVDLPAEASGSSGQQSGSSSQENGSSSQENGFSSQEGEPSSQEGESLSQESGSSSQDSGSDYVPSSDEAEGEKTISDTKKASLEWRDVLFIIEVKRKNINDKESQETPRVRSTRHSRRYADQL